MKNSQKQRSQLNLYRYRSNKWKHPVKMQLPYRIKSKHLYSSNRQRYSSLKNRQSII